MIIKRHIICLLGFLLIASIELSGQPMRIKAVDIYGNSYYSNSDIEALIQFEKKDLASGIWKEKVLEQLREAHRREGYFDMKLDSIKIQISEDSLQAALSFWIDKGDPVIVHSIKFDWGQSKHPEYLRNNLLDIFNLQGERYQERYLENQLDHLLVQSANHGFPLATLKLTNAKLVSDEVFGIQLFYQYEKGVLVTIDTIKFVGNKLTRYQTLLHELRAQTGDVFQHERLIEGYENLQRLDYIRNVSKPVFEFIDDKATVTYQLKENNPNTIDGLIGYTPPKKDEPGSKGTFTGRLELVFKNLMGTGRFVEAFWQKKEDDSQAIRFQYEEPWILGYPFFGGGQFEQIIRDSTYLERDKNLTLRYEPWATLSCDLRGGQKEILPDSLGKALLGLSKSNRWYVALGFNYQTFDVPANPTSGVRYETRLYEGTKFTAETDKSARFQSLWIDVEYVYALRTRQIFFMGLHGRDVKIENSRVPLEDQIRLGGAYTLRGYFEDSFRGHRVAWINSEYRFILSSQSRAFVFCDMGHIERFDDADRLFKTTKIGYGVGLRLETGLGRIGIDYGLGYGDGLLQGKIHVGLQNHF